MTSLWQLNILEDSNVFGQGAINDNKENLRQFQAELNRFKRLLKEFPRLNMAKQYIRYKSVLPQMRLSSNKTEISHNLSRKKLAKLMNNNAYNNPAGQRTHFLPSPDLKLDMDGKHYASFGPEAGE